MYPHNSGNYLLPKIRLNPLDNVVNRMDADFLIAFAFSVVKINPDSKSKACKVGLV
jgi:hypothetical protein